MDRNAVAMAILAAVFVAAAYAAYRTYAYESHRAKDAERAAAEACFRGCWPIVLDPPSPFPKDGVFQHPMYREIFAVPAEGNPGKYAISTVRWGKRIDLCPAMDVEDISSPAFWWDVYTEYAQVYSTGKAGR